MKKNAWGREIMTVSTYVINTDGSLSKELTQMHGGTIRERTNKRENENKDNRERMKKHHVSTVRVTCVGTNEGNEGQTTSENMTKD